MFGVFATMPIIDMKEMGIGLAAAVLIDATIVRAVLLPATMKLLGELELVPAAWLEWLPRLEHERSADVPADAQPARLGRLSSGEIRHRGRAPASRRGPPSSRARQGRGTGRTAGRGFNRAPRLGQSRHLRPADRPSRVGYAARSSASARSQCSVWSPGSPRSQRR